MCCALLGEAAGEKIILLVKNIKGGGRCFILRGVGGDLSRWFSSVAGLFQGV